MMQVVSGLFFALALVLAVSLGGQTLDYTWGPALVALAGALFLLIPDARASRRWGALAFSGFAAVAVAAAWILWRCQGSPVKEFARADALLVGALAAAFLWGWLVSASGPALKLCMAALSLLGVVNLAVGILQLKDPSFSLLFSSRPTSFPSGLFGHYNHMADFSLVAAAFLAARFAFLPKAPRFHCLFHAVGLIACIASIAISGSRGGMLSLCAGATVLAGLRALTSWRDRTRHWKMAAALALGMPLVMGGIAIPVLAGFQERRGIENSGLTTLADNRSRLQMMALAVDVTSLNPWGGGGSRSFGWNKYSAWTPSEDGVLPANDDFVHNEFLQMATDYGWTGAGLVAAAMLVVFLCGTAGVATAEGGERTRSRDALACGGLAAMAGTLLHSNFSFVTHTLPGALYLGLAMGAALPRRREPEFTPLPAFRRIAAVSAVVALASCLAFAGFLGSRAYHKAWPVFFGKERMGTGAPGMATDRIHAALEIWPGAEMAGAAALLAHGASRRENQIDSGGKDKLEEAVGLYATAGRLNPFDPEWPVNRAGILSTLDRDAEAEADYQRAILLEGGMEGIFRARYLLARHLYRKWYRAWTRERRAEEALAGFLRARELLLEADAMTAPWIRGKEGEELRRGLEETISFLEGANVTPAPPR